MISFILERLHGLIHFLHLPRGFDFWFMGIKIKWDRRKSRCWKCVHFDGYYFDEETYDCEINHCCMWVMIVIVELILSLVYLLVGR